MKVLVTGAAGFIGSAVVRRLLGSGFATTHGQVPLEVVAIDSLHRTGDWKAVGSFFADTRLTRLVADVRSRKPVEEAMHGVDVVVHCAAATNVDASFAQVDEYRDINVNGTRSVAEVAALSNVGTFVHVSTDEVYGPCNSGSFSESAPLNPTNPYSWSKALAEEAFARVCGGEPMRKVIVRPSNNYGPWQTADNLIPKFISMLSSGRRPPIYGTGFNSRCWVHVEDTVSALLTLVMEDNAHGAYNIGGEEFRNLEIAEMILQSMQCTWDQVEFAADRPVHDLRYCNDESRIAALGYRRRYSLQDVMSALVEFYGRQRA